MTCDHQPARTVRLRRSWAGFRLRWRAWWRANGRAVGLSLVCLSSSLSLVTLYRGEAQKCAIRVESRRLTRSAIAAAVDQGAIELGAGDEQRVTIGRHVDERVLKELPPPNCSPVGLFLNL